MEIASLIVSTLALIFSSLVAIYCGAKHFSTHQIQMVPIDPYTGKKAPTSSPDEDPLEEFGDLPGATDVMIQEFTKKTPKPTNVE